MSVLLRRWIWFLPLFVVLAIVVGVFFAPTEPEADFSFANGTEIKTIDPAVVTGAPEGRVVRAIFEGLLAWHPEDLRPVPGVAKEWQVLDEGKRYRFLLREDAQWANHAGPVRRVTAGDFHYSFRRFLDPITASEYSYMLTDVVGADAYNQADVQAGQAVEVELPPPTGAPLGVRGELLRGTLVRRDDFDKATREKIDDPDSEEEAEDEEEREVESLWTVSIEGKERRFALAKSLLLAEYDAEVCRQVLPDFNQTVGIKVIDDSTLDITLKSPTPHFPQLMGFYPLCPVHQESIEKYGYPGWTFPERLVSNGPFQIQYRVVRDRIRLKKNPYYWDRDNVKSNLIDVRAVASETTSLNLYEEGEVDWIITVPSPIIPVLLKQERPDFQPEPYLSSYYYVFNTERKPFDDPRVRKALSLAIYREEIVREVTGAGEKASQRFVPQGIVPYDKHLRAVGAPGYDGSNEAYAKDVAEAKRLLAEAGFPDGRGFPTFEILYNTSQGHSQIAELIQAQWAEQLGLPCKLVQKEWGSYLANRRNQEYWICRAGWIGDYVDPNTFLDLFMTDNPQNNSGWSNAEYDALLEQAKRIDLNEQERQALEEEVRDSAGWTEANHKQRLREAVDRAVQRKRMKLFYEAEQILLNEQPLIPLYFYVDKNLVRPYVRGWHRNIQDTHPLKHVYVDQEAKARFFAEKE